MSGATVLGVITARGGSKGIPGKNTRLLCGKPLALWTFEAVKKAKLLTRTILSTDSEEIAKIARDDGVEVPFIRPAELATDATPHLPVMQHALAEIEASGTVYDYVVILQPTSPLRTSEDIDATIKKAIDHGAESGVSLVQLENFAPAKVKRLEGDRVVDYFEKETKVPARQDLSAAYKRNGAVYVTKRTTLLGGSLYGDFTVGYVMPEDRSIDINTEAEWNIAEALLAARKGQ